MNFRAISFAAILGLGCANVDSVPYCESAVEVPIATPACHAEPGVQQMAGELAALIDPEAGPFLIQVEFDDSGGVESMCANRSPHYNPWHPRKRLAEAKSEIQAVAPGSTCLAGTRIDFNWTGVKYAEIDVEIDRCSAEIQSGSVPTTPSRIATGSSAMLQRRCIELAQIRRGEIWGGVFKSARAWGLIPGHFYLRTEEGKERAAAIRACTTNTTSPNRGPKDAVIQRVIVDFDEVEECMREQGWQRLL